MERNQSSSTILRLASPTRPAIAAVAPTASAGLPTATLRILFGVAWTANAALKWFPAFGAGFLGMLTDVSQGQPAFLRPWFNFVTTVASDGRATVLAAGSAALETYLAIALMTGFARKYTYVVGAGYTALIWATAEGFGGPYVPGVSTDVGAAIVYTLLFLVFLVHDAGVGSSRLSVDSFLERRRPAWRRVAELGSLRSGVNRVSVP